MNSPRHAIRAARRTKGGRQAQENQMTGPGKEGCMRYFWLLAAFIYCTFGIAANPGSLDPGAFGTKAKFSVDQTAMSLTTAVATIEPRNGAPGYSWVRIHFYSFPLTAEDVAAGTNERVWRP